MPRRRRSRSIRTYRPLKTMKYSNETVTGGAVFLPENLGAPNQTHLFNIVPSVNVIGTRKVKNFTIKASLQSNGVSTGQCLCALLYVPEGLNLRGGGGLNIGQNFGADVAATSLYEPSQNIITSWVMNYDTTTPVTISSRLARNLNSGDSIFLCMRPIVILNEGENLQFLYTCNYALAYN